MVTVAANIRNTETSNQNSETHYWTPLRDRLDSYIWVISIIIELLLCSGERTVVCDCECKFLNACDYVLCCRNELEGLTHARR